MILAPLFGSAMVIAVATGPLDDPMGLDHLSPRQKSAVTETLVRSATDCIVHAVFADPRYNATGTAALGDLIVASMPSCVTPVRAIRRAVAGTSRKRVMGVSWVGRGVASR